MLLRLPPAPAAASSQASLLGIHCRHAAVPAVASEQAQAQQAQIPRRGTQHFSSNGTGAASTSADTQPLRQRGHSRASGQRGRSVSPPRSAGSRKPNLPPRPAAQLRGKPQRLQQRGGADAAATDPLALPDMPQYQPLRAPGSVGRQDVTAAITASQRWEEVAALVDHQEMDAITLAAAFGHLAKLHAMAGSSSDVPHAIKASGLLERMTQRAVALAGMPGRFPGRNVSAILAACAKLGVNPGEPALLALSAAAARNLRTFSPGHAANTVRAFGTLRFRPEGALLADLAEAALAGAASGGRGGGLSPYNVGSLAWGYARLCAHPGGRLLQALEGCVTSSGEKFKAAHLAETLWGFGTLGHAPAGATVTEILRQVAAADGRDPPFGFGGATAAMALSGLAKLRSGATDSDSGSPGSSRDGSGDSSDAEARAGSFGGGSGGSGRPADSAGAAAGSPEEAAALRVLTSALAAGAGDLNAPQLAQALSAIAQLPPECAAAAQRPLCAAVASKATAFAPHVLCKALTAMEALAVAGAAAEAAAGAAAAEAAPPGIPQGSTSARKRLSAEAMQTVEDGSEDEAAARFVESLSGAQQALADAEAAAAGSSSSGDDDPLFSPSDDEEDRVEGFLLDGGFALSPGGGDPSAAEAPEAAHHAAASRAAAAARSPAHAALTALARQLRLTARRFEPAAMLAALRSFAALAQPPPGGTSSGAAAAGAPSGFLLPADVLGALGSDILARRLQFSKVQRGEAAVLLGRLAAARGVGLASVQALAQETQL